MNAQRKKSAVTKYTEVQNEGGYDKEGLIAVIATDEKGYSADEINEIVDAILESPNPIVKQKGTVKGPVTFEEWRVEIRNKKATKLSMLRPRVVISEEEADVLNRGVIDGGNTYAAMYFLPE